MPISGKRSPFQTADLNKVPEDNGVFQLLSSGKTIYFGYADEAGLKSKIREHYTGKHGSCTKIATGFKYEVHEDPQARCEQLLKEYEKKFGIVPRCNLSD
ncbi:MAG TPA: hypothetical protein VNI20_09460 [Fimbriimonadaceae bacterium]|nr:hypothetical protein [Fimbriimonadaceae bacterium]